MATVYITVSTTQALPTPSRCGFGACPRGHRSRVPPFPWRLLRALVIVVAISKMASSMRIALVTGHTIPGPRSSGSAAAADPQVQGFRVAALAHALAEFGHQVTIYARQDSPARPRTSTAAGVKIEY